MIHRDLKPANVQVMLDGTVKVLDFGIAQAVLAATTVTTGSVDVPAARVMIAGTPGYMSPEQMAGAVVDERSDSFSLGIVLFEWIAGRLPFPAVPSPNGIGGRRGRPAGSRSAEHAAGCRGSGDDSAQVRCAETDHC